MGKDHKVTVFTVFDRVSLYAKIRAVPNKSAKLVKYACIESLSQMHIKTITFDNDLVRQFLPKKERLDTVSDEKIQWI